MMYLYRDYHFLYSIFYSILFNFSLAMFIIEKINNKKKIDTESNDNKIIEANEDDVEIIGEPNNQEIEVAEKAPVDANISEV